MSKASVGGLPREWNEPTARNLLRTPLVFGVSQMGLTGLGAVAVSANAVLGPALHGPEASILIGIVGYAGLRIAARRSLPGWEEVWIERISHKFAKKKMQAEEKAADAGELLEVISPDTLTSADLLRLKISLAKRLDALADEEERIFQFQADESGAVLSMGALGCFKCEQLPQFAYSLVHLPVSTHPDSMFYILKKLQPPFTVFIRMRALSQSKAKRRIEVARKNNAAGNESVSNLDAEVSFKESSLVLENLSRGTEKIFEFSLVVSSPSKQALDKELFHLEKDIKLTTDAITGKRRRFFRSHWVRTSTAADLIPNVFDPKESGPAILRTERGYPLYFSPLDSRLNALHWLVVGGTGTGKSFYTGLVLKRMLDAGERISVFILDHHHSFRRLVNTQGHGHFEPRNIPELESSLRSMKSAWNQVGTLTAVELSELRTSEKRKAMNVLLTEVAEFLRARNTDHPLYVVIDECWMFMRDEPELVQQAFREFRKLNGAMIAVTQSLSDFLTDETGQTICQNAPVRVLLRQDEDISRFRGILGLNDTEVGRLQGFLKENGKFSDCLIKTPFLSRIGQLIPTHEEHELLRTDNLRADRVREAKEAELKSKEGLSL